MTPEFLNILACPICKKKVELRDNSLVCASCNKLYPIKDGISNMLVGEAHSI